MIESAQSPKHTNLSSMKEDLEQPDEDAREELNLPEINKVLIKDLIKNNGEALAQIENQESVILEQIASKFRQRLRFMQQPVQVWAADELIDDTRWKTFIDDVSWGISDRTGEKPVKAIFVINQSENKDI